MEEENLDETEQLDEGLEDEGTEDEGLYNGGYEETPQEQNFNPRRESARDAYRNTIGNKDYYKNKDNELRDNLEKAKNKKEEAKQEANRDFKKKDPKDNTPFKVDGSDTEKKNIKDKFDDLKNKHKANKDVLNAKKDILNNKINSAKAKAFKYRHPMEAAKEQIKERAKQKAKDVGKKAGKAAAKGAKKAGKAAVKGAQQAGKALVKILSKLPPPVLIAVAIGGFVILFIVLLLVLVSGGNTGDGTGGGGYGYSGGGPTSTDKNEFMCAMINPLTKGKDQTGVTVESYFGYRNPSVGSKFHRGIDIWKADGSPIYAAQSGTVISAGYNGGYGNSVFIEHANGFVSVYGHMQDGSLLVSSGAKVSQGQQLGKQGNTGTSGGSHLHFEIRDGGIAFSVDEFFGISDQGKWANCIVEGSGATHSQCSQASVGSQRANTINFQEEVCSKYQSSSGGAAGQYSFGTYVESEVEAANTSMKELILVNKKYKVESSYINNQISKENGGSADGYSLASAAATAYKQMDANCPHKMFLVSGHRSYQAQETNWKRAAEPGYDKELYRARPGHSEHHTGYAIDINDVHDTFDTTETYTWLKAHAYEYGFIMRYPKGKEGITGYGYEPWHYRYVGVDVAKDMHDNYPDLTYDEYYMSFIHGKTYDQFMKERFNK